MVLRWTLATAAVLCVLGDTRTPTLPAKQDRSTLGQGKQLHQHLLWAGRPAMALASEVARNLAGIAGTNREPALKLGHCPTGPAHLRLDTRGL